MLNTNGLSTDKILTKIDNILPNTLSRIFLNSFLRRDRKMRQYLFCIHKKVATYISKALKQIDEILHFTFIASLSNSYIQDILMFSSDCRPFILSTLIVLE